MAYDEGLAQRIREIFEQQDNIAAEIIEKKMFGGLAFMLSGNMCVGIVDETLMARVGPEQYEDALQHPHAREMDFTGKPLKGFIYVDAEGIVDDSDLQEWITRCMTFADSLPAK